MLRSSDVFVCIHVKCEKWFYQVLTMDKVKMIAVIVWATVRLPDSAPTLNTKQDPAKFSIINTSM